MRYHWKPEPPHARTIKIANIGALRATGRAFENCLPHEFDLIIEPLMLGQMARKAIENKSGESVLGAFRIIERKIGGGS